MGPGIHKKGSFADNIHWKTIQEQCMWRGKVTLEEREQMHLWKGFPYSFDSGKCHSASSENKGESDTEEFMKIHL